MLRAAPSGRAARPPPSWPVPPPTPVTEQSGSMSEQWAAYTQGGAQLDDTEVRKKIQNANEKYMEGRSTPPGGHAVTLIDLSPTKVQPSASTHLLLEELQLGTRVHTSEILSYATAAKKTEKGKSKPIPLLLD